MWKIKNEELEKLDQRDFINDDYIENKKYDYSYLLWLFFIKFSELEHEINISTVNLINERTHDIWYSIIESLSFSNKLEIFTKLSKKYISISGKDKTILEKLNYLIKNIKEISEFRNILAHANWISARKWWFIRVKIISDKEDWLVNFKYIKILPRNIKWKITKIDNILEKLYWINEKITWL